MKKTRFKIQIELPIAQLFKHNGRLFVIHKNVFEGSLLYRCSDYLTGMAVTDTDSEFLKRCKLSAKATLDKNKDFDFSKYTIINQP